jgi:hypothetical protein
VATLLGSHLLVGITYLRPDGRIDRHLQFHGTVESVDEDVVEVRRADNGEIFTLPAGPETYQPAPPGEYRLKTTGKSSSTRTSRAPSMWCPRTSSRTSAVEP